MRGLLGIAVSPSANCANPIIIIHCLPGDVIDGFARLSFPNPVPSIEYAQQPMTFQGHIKNGQILLDQPASLPEGAQVKIEVVEIDAKAGAPTGIGTLSEKLRAIAGSVEGPPDWAENHDHYIHGTPKRT